MTILKSLVRRWDRFAHNQSCAGILKTAPLTTRPAPVKILSMVCHRDVIMYLVAAKSFYRQLGRGSFVLIDDGSLTQEDRALLELHLGSPVILPIADVSTHGCPRGGTWERLIKILELAERDYVIQLDADTLTVGAVQMVRDCVDARRSFTLGTGQGRRFTTALEAAKTAQAAPGNHLQDVSERAMDRLENAGTLKYVRGCSGFAGFAPEAGRLKLVQDFSARMSEFLQTRWREWGSEQVASNFAVANSASAQVLPYPAYGGPLAEAQAPGAEFLHFIGSYRYDRGIYTRLSRAFINRPENSSHGNKQD